MNKNINYPHNKSTKSLKEKPLSLSISNKNNTNWDGYSPSAAWFHLKSQVVESRLRVFNALQYFVKLHPFATPSHDTLCKMTHLSLKTVKRSLDELKELGVISWVSGKQRRVSNSYSIHEVFLGKKIQKIMKAFFINLAYCLVLLGATPIKGGDLLDRSKDIPNTQKSFSDTDTVTITEPLLASMLLSMAEHKRKPSPQELFNPSFYNTPTLRCVKKDVLVGKSSNEGVVMYTDSLELLKNNLDKLPLTTHGVLKLSVYPRSVLEWLLKQKLFYTANDFFASTMGLCKKKASELGMHKVDYTTYNQTRKALNISEDEPLVDMDALEELKQETAKQFPQAISTTRKMAMASDFDGDKPTFDKLSNKRPQNPEEFIYERKKTIETIKSMRELGDNNPFRKILLDAFENETQDSPANPLISDGPTIQEVKNNF